MPRNAYLIPCGARTKVQKSHHKFPRLITLQQNSLIIDSSLLAHFSQKLKCISERKNPQSKTHQFYLPRLERKMVSVGALWDIKYTHTTRATPTCIMWKRWRTGTQPKKWRELAAKIAPNTTWRGVERAFTAAGFACEMIAFAARSNVSVNLPISTLKSTPRTRRIKTPTIHSRRTCLRVVPACRTPKKHQNEYHFL
jgi:hypothetical protein